MNKNQVFFTLLILSLLVFPLLTSCQSTIPAQAKAINSEVTGSDEDTNFDYDLAADHQAYRWLAMARFYEKNGMLNTKLDPGDLMAYRWNAMAEGYQRYGLLNYADNPDDVMAFRWLAMARFYEQHDLLNDQMDPGDLMAYRWLAMARTYEKLGLLNEK